MTRQASQRSISVRSRRDRPITALASRSDGRVPCDVCTRFYKLHEGQQILCVVRAPREGRIVLTTYGRSSGHCIDPIEKKPLHHFLPGTPVLSCGTAGCNLACKFCQNWDTSKSRAIETLADEAGPKAIPQAAVRLGCRVPYTYNHPHCSIAIGNPAHRVHTIFAL